MEPLILEFTREEFEQRIRGWLEAMGDVPPLFGPTILGLYEDRPDVALVEFKRRGGGKVSLDVEPIAPRRIKVTPSPLPDKNPPESKEFLRDFWRELGPGKRGGPHKTPRKQRLAIVREWLEVKGNETQKIFCDRKGISTSQLREWTRELESEIRTEEIRAKGLS